MNIDNEVLNLEKQILIDKDFLFNNPEEGLNEFKTAKYIVKRLEEIGIQDIKTNVYGNGILATIKFKEDGPCILLRSELDALVMDKDGRCKHTCGHDAHMTILLAIAKLIMDNKEKLKGTIKLLFESDEEGNGGAKKMIELGVLENPHVDKVFAVHVWSQLEEGTIGINSGAQMASTDPFEIIVKGKGGHAAIPEKCIDTIQIASQIALKIKSMATINVNDDSKLVLGITAFHSGINNNLIPNEAKLKGICRSYNNSLRNEIKCKLIDESEKIARQFGGEIEFKYVGNYPAVVNDEKEAKIIEQLSTNIAENVDNNFKTMSSDDFSFFLNERPGAMIMIGCQTDGTIIQHGENFKVGIKPILIGIQIYYEIVKKYLM